MATDSEARDALQAVALGVTYTARDVTLSGAHATGTPILAANPRRRSVIIMPPGQCRIAFHASDTDGIVSGLDFDRSGPACPKNALYLRGLTSGVVRIEEGE